MSYEYLDELAAIIRQRRQAADDSSYVSSLFAKGIYKISQKVGEEGVETALAAVKGDKAEVVSESADLIFHLLIALEASGVTLAEVIAELERRRK